MSVATGGKVRFSYCMLPDYSLSDSIEMIKVADELGYYACYSVDETWHKSSDLISRYFPGDLHDTR